MSKLGEALKRSRRGYGGFDCLEPQTTKGSKCREVVVRMRKSSLEAFEDADAIADVSSGLSDLNPVKSLSSCHLELSFSTLK